MRIYWHMLLATYWIADLGEETWPLCRFRADRMCFLTSWKSFRLVKRSLRFIRLRFYYIDIRSWITFRAWQWPYGQKFLWFRKESTIPQDIRIALPSHVLYVSIIVHVHLIGIFVAQMQRGSVCLQQQNWSSMYPSQFGGRVNAPAIICLYIGYVFCHLNLSNQGNSVKFLPRSIVARWQCTLHFR